MKSVGPDWTPRTITIICDSSDHPNEVPELAALVSYEYEGYEWWDADERADHQTEIVPDTPENRARPDIAVALARSADRFKIACTLCHQDFTSGDHLGIGYRSQSEISAEIRLGQTTAQRLDRQRPNHAGLSAVADAGVLCLSVSGLGRYIQPRR